VKNGENGELFIFFFVVNVYDWLSYCSLHSVQKNEIKK
jgi:hypothetical protein